jgi:hypothetical protein
MGRLRERKYKKQYSEQGKIPKWENSATNHMYINYNGGNLVQTKIMTYSGGSVHRSYLSRPKSVDDHACIFLNMHPHT